MELHNQTDHVAILSLMMVGALVERLDQIGQIDNKTAHRLHKLVEGVRIHARHCGIDDLNVLLDNIEGKVERRAKKPLEVVEHP